MEAAEEVHRAQAKFNQVRDGHHYGHGGRSQRLLDQAIKLTGTIAIPRHGKEEIESVVQRLNQALLQADADSSYHLHCSTAYLDETLSNTIK
jgi:hypothetical protein